MSRDDVIRSTLDVMDADYHEEVCRLCPDCRTPKQAATRNGYTCPRHFELFYGRTMPTLGEIESRSADPNP